MSGHPRIVRKADGLVLARATRPEQVIALEDNWYFHPDAVNHAVLETSDRIYSCPYKGICQWVDLKINNEYVNDVAWVYPEPKPGFRKIAGWYGFYNDAKGYAEVDGG